jgi:hypothetical protein
VPPATSPCASSGSGTVPGVFPALADVAPKSPGPVPDARFNPLGAVGAGAFFADDTLPQFATHAGLLTATICVHGVN